MVLEQITSEVLRLSAHDRALLAETLWESLETPFVFLSDISDQDAIKLSKQRNEEIEKGTVTALSHEELMSRLRT